VSALDRLDLVDWAAYPDGYGAPTEIPHLIRAAVADGRGVGENEALDELSHALCHQFSVSAVAEPVVPILVMLAGEVEYPLSAELISIVGYCAEPRDRFGDGGRRLVATTDADPIRAAVASLLPDLLRLGAADPRLRPDIGAVVAELPEHAANTARVLHEWFEAATEGDNPFALALSLALLGDRGVRVCAELERPPDYWPVEMHGRVLDWLLDRPNDEPEPTRFDRAHANLEAAWGAR